VTGEEVNWMPPKYCNYLKCRRWAHINIKSYPFPVCAFCVIHFVENHLKTHENETCSNYFRNGGIKSDGGGKLYDIRTFVNIIM
jgi:hypothetical protein